MTETTALDRFKAMATMRHFEEACLRGSMARDIHGELHLGIGQEAVSAGMVGTLTEGDAVVSTHRNHCHGIAKGVPLKAFMAEIFEKETGLCRGRGGHMHPFDPERNFSATGIVGSSIPVALGYAYAFRLEKRANIAVGVTGEGGSNAGAFHECLNIAAAWKLPLVILVENNSYAISVKYEEVTATPTVAERAAAYGAWGRKVDGTDVEAVAEAFAEAAGYTRGGNGPAVLEATCYRFRGHYEGDHDGYRSREERKRMREEHDPLTIGRKSLVASGAATDAELDAIVEASQAEIAAIVAEVRADPLPAADEALKYRFVET
jgi:pyruvate dehydrogenase E1 component alpha subunit